MINTQFNPETNVLSFEDFLESSAQLKVGSCVEIPFNGYHTQKRFVVTTSTQIEQTSPRGKKCFMNAFTATPV